MSFTIPDADFSRVVCDDEAGGIVSPAGFGRQTFFVGDLLEEFVV